MGFGNEFGAEGGAILPVGGIPKAKRLRPMRNRHNPLPLPVVVQFGEEILEIKEKSAMLRN
jgi:hypothetical protein